MRLAGNFKLPDIFLESLSFSGLLTDGIFDASTLAAYLTSIRVTLFHLLFYWRFETDIYAPFK